MAIKETTIHTRPNTNVLWFHEWQQAQSNSSSIISTYSDYFDLTSSQSEDGLSLEVVRLWNNQSKFVESRSSFNDPQADLQYFNYLFDNGMSVTKKTEQV